MIVSVIVAMDENNGIGFENSLPWRLSSNLQRFKALTMGHHLIMGRVTFESIGRILPGRVMIVISRNFEYKPEGCLIARSLPEALQFADDEGDNEVFVIGGAQIFAEALPIATRIYLTRVHAEVVADVHFPDLDEDEWVIKRADFHPPDENNQYAYTFKYLERCRSDLVEKT